MFFLDGGSGCGNVLTAQTTNFIGSLVKVIKTLVPIILIIMGSLEFAKATVAQNDDGLKKAKTNFIQKLIAGVAVFFVITFVSWLLGFLGESFGNKALECVSQFLGGSYTPGDIGSGGSSGGNSEEDYISCTKQCKELNNATAQYECQKSCDAKYDKYATTTVTDTYSEYENCKQDNCGNLSGIAYHNCISTKCNDKKPESNPDACSIELYGKEYCDCYESKCINASGILLANCKSICKAQITITTTKSNLTTCYDECKQVNKCTSQRTCNKTGYSKCKKDCDNQYLN